MRILDNPTRGMTPKDKRLLYLTAVLPVLMYGFQIWYRHDALNRSQET